MNNLIIPYFVKIKTNSINIFRIRDSLESFMKALVYKRLVLNKGIGSSYQFKAKVMFTQLYHRGLMSMSGQQKVVFIFSSSSTGAFLKNRDLHKLIDNFDMIRIYQYDFQSFKRDYKSQIGSLSYLNLDQTEEKLRELNGTIILKNGPFQKLYTKMSPFSFDFEWKFVERYPNEAQDRLTHQQEYFLSTANFSILKRIRKSQGWEIWKDNSQNLNLKGKLNK